MAKGVYYTKHLDLTQTKGIYEQPVENWNFLYADPSTTKSSEFDIGDRVVLPDGREFVYAKSAGSNILYAAHGVSFTYTGYTSYTAFATNHAKGSMEITVPAATHAALSEDDLRGGYVILFDGASDYDTTVRGICGNDSADADAAFDIQLDAPIHNAIVAATEACEVYQNPWAAIDVGTTNLPKAGVPTTTVSAAANYFWVQTKGICWVAPQSGLGDSNGQEGGFWRHDGSLDKADTALATTVPAGSSSQYAGYCIQGSQSGNGPLFVLTPHI